MVGGKAVLHLLPLRIIVTLLVLVLGGILSLIAYTGLVDQNGIWAASAILRISSYSYIGIALILVMSWRWIPPAQALIFPYIGGTWLGSLHFHGEFGSGERQITLRVKHTLFGIKMMLDTSESTSSTMFVHADKDPDFGECKLFYGYSTKRRDGVRGSKESYRGLAILNISVGESHKLIGSYFTEAGGNGDLTLTRSRPHPWWMLWR